MTKTRGAIYATLAIVGLVVLWAERRKHDGKIDAAIKSTTLAPGDIDRIIVDPRRHTIEVVSKTGIKKSFLPDSGASVDISKTGSGSISVRSWGTETVPFMGFALGSDLRARAALGINLFYIYRWETGGGLLISNDIKDTRAFVHVGYNVYDNALVSVGVDNKHTVHLVASLKF